MKKSIARLWMLSWGLVFYAVAVRGIADSEIEIRLPAQYSLQPLYLSSFSGETKEETPFLKSLRKVLEFDLRYSGYFSPISQEKAIEEVLSQKDPKKAFDLAFWQGRFIPYIVQVHQMHQKLKVIVFSRENQGYKSLSEISLSGSLAEDRRKIHKIADEILFLLCRKKGIASTRFLYTIRTKNPSKNGPKWLSEVWMSDWDGGNAHPVTKENSYCVHPLFLPKQGKKSSEFLYVSYRSGPPKIYRASLDGTQSLPLVSLGGNQLLPSLSLFGDMLAFISDVAGRPDLFLQRLNSTGEAIYTPLQLFSFPRATQASSTFSPDGRKLAFVSDKGGSPRIYLLNIGERLQKQKRPELVLITKKNLQNVTPVWSPDGKKLAYSAKTDDVRQIWIFDFETQEEWQLTSGAGNKENPFWAPDSLHIVFNTEDCGVSELCLVNLHQPEVVKIAKGRFPAWEGFP